MIFFTGDTHFYHKNILKYCPRPYKTIGNMNKALIKKWNETVGPEDEVYHLGDFAMKGSASEVCKILEELNGKKHLIRGNHDQGMDKQSWDHGGKRPERYFEWSKDYHELKIWDEEMDVNQRIVLCHYPLQVWNGSHHGSWMLHGHCHGTLPATDGMSRLDVGVDPRGLKPISYDEVKAIMTRKVFKPVDHHGDEGRTGS